MKATASTLAVALLVAGVSAQNSTSGGNSTDYATGLVQALGGAGLTTLAGVLQGYPDIARMLEMGGNYTVFAPNNDAFNNLGDISSINASMIQSILSYHISPAMWSQSTLTTGANHTIIPSLLQERLLGENQTAPLVSSFGTDGQPRIRTATQNVTVGANTTYMNLHVNVIDAVLQIPYNLSATVGALNLTGLSGALSAVSSALPVTALEETERITVFAPDNAAFQNLSSVIATLNTSQIATVLGNHVINGSVVYSTEIRPDNTTAISAAGETFSFRMMNGTLYVLSGNSTMAPIIRTDIPITNGVLHVIGGVLANPMSNPEAARSAAAAAETARPTGGIGAAAGNKDAKTGAGFKTVVGYSTVAAVLMGALAILV